MVADRLSLRWYLGYDLREPLPDHSSLTKIRSATGWQPSARACYLARSYGVTSQWDELATDAAQT